MYFLPHSSHTPHNSMIMFLIAQPAVAYVRCGGRYVTRFADSCAACPPGPPGVGCESEACQRGNGAGVCTERFAPAWRQWHGQKLQDCFVQALLGQKREGYFIDLAANDAAIISNTYTLERHYGWRGLTVEPNPIYHAAHRALRPNSTLVPAAVSSANALRAFKFSGVFGHLGGVGGGSGNGTRLVRVLRTDELFAEARVPAWVDYMSLDVEKHEAEVLAAFPWASHTVSILTVEDPTAPVAAQLSEHGYKELCRLHEKDTLFVHWASWRKHPLVRRILSGEKALTCERAGEVPRISARAEAPAEGAEVNVAHTVCSRSPQAVTDL